MIWSNIAWIKEIRLYILCILIDYPPGWLRLPLLLPMGTIPIDTSFPALNFHQDFASFSRFIFSSILLTYQNIPSNTAFKKNVCDFISCKLMDFLKEKKPSFILVVSISQQPILLESRTGSSLSLATLPALKQIQALNKVICLLVHKWLELETEMVSSS